MNKKLLILFFFIKALFLYIKLDLIWFAVYSQKNVYGPQLSLINSNSKFRLRIPVAILTWILLAAGLTTLLFSLKEKNRWKIFLIGFLYGFVVYGVYNGTNYATIEKYKVRTAIIDTLWGSIAGGIIATIASL
tara:strand:+ start:1360 stop:1758 length:399 start_codon:yes stop_codon:yes gene_type:complete